MSSEVQTDPICVFERKREERKKEKDMPDHAVYRRRQEGVGNELERPPVEASESLGGVWSGGPSLRRGLVLPWPTEGPRIGETEGTGEEGRPDSSQDGGGRRCSFYLPPSQHT